MVASMTAFGRCATQQDWGQAVWELRSVNHRYLDLSFKIPESFRAWEIPWRNQLAKLLQRGKVECHLSFQPSAQLAPHLEVNKNLVEQLILSCQQLSQYSQVDTRLKARDLLIWPGVLTTRAKEISSLEEPLTKLLLAAAQELNQTRYREGEQLKQLLQDKLAQIACYVQKAEQKLPTVLSLQREKLLHKLQEIQTALDPQRLEYELVLFAQRIDVQEEIDRLKTHIQEVQRNLNSHQSQGRRLDFLMQEMNREANTLGAKAADDEIANAAIELKVLIEQMREQIQNVE